MRQKELEQRADEINQILKSFNKGQQTSMVNSNNSSNQDQMRLMENNQETYQIAMDMPLQKTHSQVVKSHQSEMVQNRHPDENLGQINMAQKEIEEPQMTSDTNIKQYESPQFFVGSGNKDRGENNGQREPMSMEFDRTADGHGDGDVNRFPEDNQENHSFSKGLHDERDSLTALQKQKQVIDQFSFQRTNLLTDQSQDDDEEDDGTDVGCLLNSFDRSGEKK